MADDKIRYVLDVDDKGSPKLVKFGTVAETSGKKASKSFKGASEAIGEVAQRIPGAGMAMDVMTRGPLVGASVAVAGLAAGFGAMVMSSINAADHINDLSLRLGISTERLSVLSMYAEQSGTDIDALASAMGKLGNKVASGDKGLKAYGVTANSADEALFQLADKVAATEDPMLRLKIATDAFGKSGQEMLPLLVQGGAALREMGANAPIVSTEMAKMADEFNDKMAELKGSFTSAGLSMAEAFMPTLQKMLEVSGQVATAIAGGKKAAQMGGDEWAKEAARIRDELKNNPSDYKRITLEGELKNAEQLSRNFTQTAAEIGIGAMSGQSGVYRGESLVSAPAKTYDSPEGIKAREAARAKANEQEKTFESWRDGIRKKRQAESLEAYQAQMEAVQEEADFEANVAARLVEFNSGLQAEFRADQAEQDATARETYLQEEQAALDERFALQMNYANQLEGVLSSSFASALRDGTNLWSSLGEGFKNMLIEMAAQMAARAAIFGLFNLVSGGGFGLAAGGLSKYVFRAGGGPYEAGDNLVTQERRAEAIIPRGPGRVAPTAQGGDTITIVVQNPTQAVSVRRQLTKDDRRRNTGLR